MSWFNIQTNMTDKFDMIPQKSQIMLNLEKSNQTVCLTSIKKALTI